MSKETMILPELGRLSTSKTLTKTGLSHIVQSRLIRRRRAVSVPIYEYECESCDERFELMQKFSDKPVKKCPKCRGAVHKVLSPPALLFKGSGWYVTDYANPERKKAQKADGDGKTSTSTSTPSTASTSKAAAKSDD
jgi:putative FmdB family regulatory protein